MTPRYSICSTNYNTAPVIEKHLESLLKQIDGGTFEIIVVDSRSNDGSFELLKDYEKKFDFIRIVSKKCIRGIGRQIAFEHSRGEYIITVDCDTIYFPQWRMFIDAYEKKVDSTICVQGVYSGIFPRACLEKVGGWRAFQTGEDYDLWARLLKINALKWYPLHLGQNYVPDSKDPEFRVSRSRIEVLSRLFLKYRDAVRLRGLDRVKKDIKSWGKPLKYYGFWLPLLSAAAISDRLSGFEHERMIITRDLFLKNLIDLGVDGTKILTWPHIYDE